jgi:hypothetical protein
MTDDKSQICNDKLVSSVTSVSSVFNSSFAIAYLAAEGGRGHDDVELLDFVRLNRNGDATAI